MRIKYWHLEVVPVLSERGYLGKSLRFLSVKNTSGVGGDGDDDDGKSDKDDKSRWLILPEAHCVQALF